MWHPENRMIQFYNNNSILPFYKCNQYIIIFSLTLRKYKRQKIAHSSEILTDDDEAKSEFSSTVS